MNPKSWLIKNILYTNFLCIFFGCLALFFGKMGIYLRNKACWTPFSVQFTRFCSYDSAIVQSQQVFYIAVQTFNLITNILLSNSICLTRWEEDTPMLHPKSCRHFRRKMIMAKWQWTFILDTKKNNLEWISTKRSAR